MTFASSDSTAARLPSDLPDAAADYARRDWPVFPVQPLGKRPMTKHGLHDATTNAAIVRSWWSRRPTPNVGIPMARLSGLVALDVDGDDGHASLRALEARHGPLPRTWSQTTPRGGEHFIFRHPGGHVPNSVARLGPGLDV